MSKLTKLLLHPRVFFKDWKANREFDRLVSSEAAANGMQTNLQDEDTIRQTELDLRKTFETFILPHFKMVQLPDSREGFVNVGVLAEERVRLLKALFVLTAKLPIRISTKKQGVQYALSNLSFREGYDLLFEENQWILDFEHDRDLFNPAKFGKKSASDPSGIYEKKIDEFLRDVISASNAKGDIQDFFIEDAPSEQRIRIAIWRKRGRFYQSGGENVVASKLPMNTAETFGLFKVGKGARLETIHPCPVDAFCAFPIDFVYTWVNHLDPHWQSLYLEHAQQASNVSNDTMSMDRFFNRDELKYSLRSIDKFAPWVRKIYVVTNCAPPKWLNQKNDSICFIDHAKLFDEADLPTFNSHAIEARLHHIPELSEHFVYLNDDMFLGRKTAKEDFFLSNGVSASVLESYGVVNGEPDESDPDYLNAARNGKKLIEERYGLSPTQLHTHSPYCLNRDVLYEMEREFEALFKATSSSRFREIANISIPSFLYHHYAYHEGKAYRKRERTILLKIDSDSFNDKVREIKKLECLSFCLNDGKSSTNDKKWNRTVAMLLQSVFPQKSSFEK